jgi:FkbM family methyltransferase
MIRDYKSWYGTENWLAFGSSRLTGWPAVVRARPPGFSRDVYMRPRTTDLKVYHQIFTARHYDVELAQPPRTIMDFGGNVGYASVWFAQKYPKARIVAVEPSADNFCVLLKNINPYPNVVGLFAAIWDNNATVEIERSDMGAWAFKSRNSGGACGIGRACGLTIETLMTVTGMRSVDLLKVDIEGAEQQLLSGDCTWLRDVGVLAIETHEYLCPGIDARVVELGSHYFDYRAHIGEYTYLAKRQFIKALRNEHWKDAGERSPNLRVVGDQTTAKTSYHVLNGR